MALKDWKKVKDVLVWDNISVDYTDRLEIYKGEVRRLSQDDAITLKNFKTDKQAIAFAKSYMRTH